jgi:hypothetical protein
LKGHGFSRAARAAKETRALAPEGLQRCELYKNQIWEEARDLVLYQHSVPLKSTKYVDLYAMMAKHDPSAD